MVRGARISYPKSWYHVINRGHSRRFIYFNLQHYHDFLDLLGVITEKFEVEIHSFSLMGNHYHLLVYTKNNNLSQAIQYLNSNFARKFNKNRNRDGNVFKGRFKSILIQNTKYLLNVSRYIHLNPVEAGLVKKPQDYQWSSYRDYFLNESRFDWLRKDYILSTEFDYHEYVSQGVPLKLRQIYSKERLIPVLK